MELDELKKELNLKITRAHQEISAADIALMMKKDTVSIVKKIQRNLHVEILISVLLAIACVYMVFFQQSWINTVFFGFFGILAAIFIAVLVMLHEKTKRLSVSPVKETLENIINLMDEYVKRYMQFTVVLLPLSFILALWLSYNDPEKVLKPMSTGSIVYISFTMLAIGTAVYFFTKWYLQKLYGKYILQLKGLLKEFDEH